MYFVNVGCQYSSNFYGDHGVLPLHFGDYQDYWYGYLHKHGSTTHAPYVYFKRHTIPYEDFYESTFTDHYVFHTPSPKKKYYYEVKIPRYVYSPHPSLNYPFIGYPQQATVNLGAGKRQSKPYLNPYTGVFSPYGGFNYGNYGSIKELYAGGERLLVSPPQSTTPLSYQQGQGKSFLQYQLESAQSNLLPAFVSEKSVDGHPKSFFTPTTEGSVSSFSKSRPVLLDSHFTESRYNPSRPSKVLEPSFYGDMLLTRQTPPPRKKPNKIPRPPYEPRGQLFRYNVNSERSESEGGFPNNYPDDKLLLIGHGNMDILEEYDRNRQVFFPQQAVLSTKPSPTVGSDATITSRDSVTSSVPTLDGNKQLYAFSYQVRRKRT